MKAELAEPIKALIEAEPSFGYRMVAGLLDMNKNTVVLFLREDLLDIVVANCLGQPTGCLPIVVRSIRVRTRAKQHANSIEISGRRKNSTRQGGVAVIVCQVDKRS